MTQRKEKKASMKNDKRNNEETCENAVMKQVAKERGKEELKLHSADVEQDQEQPEDDGIYELPALFNLVVQRYEGETSEGQLHGEGVACFEGGHVYKGLFSMGLMDGPGVFTWASGLKYEGEFVCNMPLGQGTYTWPDGSSYKGEVYNGVRHGTGTYKCAKNGVSYTGQWHQSKRHGKGAVYYNQDKTSWYRGDWVKNNREGWGVRCYPSGNIYSGEWKNNLRNGEGTMRWVKLGQQYVGQWQDGIQHGRGTQVWILRRMDRSQYCQSNQYMGDFVQGQRHGKGSFYYAGGAIYEGEWKNNKKHGQGKFTFKDGRVFEGEFVDDQMMTPNLSGNRPPTPHGAFPMSGEDPSILGPDMSVNIECLLEKIPERKCDTERKQVEFVMLTHNKELKSIYSFYSRLGHTQLPDNTFLLSRMQLWRLLKDCNIHHHGITLTQLDLYIREDATSAEIHSPFTPMLLCRLLSCLVVVAYHIYHKDMVLQKYLLAACFSKLLTDDILPNAKIVKGFLFKWPECSTAVSVKYLKKCWEIYQAYCRVNAAPRDDYTMTCRHLLWMFKELHLLDSKLTTARLLEVITAESHDPSNPSSCLDLEITFLEFFEALLGCAEVKCQQVSEGLEESLSPSSAEAEATRNSQKEEASEKTLLTANSPPQMISSVQMAAPVSSLISPEVSSPKSVEAGRSSNTPELSTAQDVESQQDTRHQKSQSAEHTGERQVIQTRGMEAKGRQMELWIQKIHQFFIHFFFPAFDHHQLATSNMKEEELRQEAQRRIALDKAQQRARLKVHWEDDKDAFEEAIEKP
ncbi:radial spoke head 10 homolog B isoform X1 [Thunnus maccoyii]|uniref:radial spoke head 10 homolog B isoform X1 n=1 Tax=Thunnus maccoyii TaxID=8240 RepID=UPI001C4CCD7B|nr:radial spoke head 10 homolog B isoform X1 [Thunnus maccoyii]